MIFERIALEDDEKILSIVHRHWFYLCMQCAYVVVLMVMPVLGVFILSLFTPHIASALSTTYAAHALFLFAFWVLINWMILAFIWTDHYLDIWAITDRRIIKIDQVSLFRRQIGSFRLERLQDLNIEINGIIATLFDYGTIHAETASGKDEEFKASYLPHPQEIKSIILSAADARNQQSHL